MQTFDSDGVEIAYDVEGSGPPVLLIHGFASNGRVNWVGPGWVKYLTERGRQVITIDNRGHGESEKLYDDSVYGAQEMAEDARRLLDHLGIASADIMGYSMGARICAFLAIAHPERVNSAVIAGMAYNMVRGYGRGDRIAEALDADSEEGIETPEALAFRRFAVKTGSDLKALAACMRSRGHKITMDMLSTLSMPVLVVAGTADDVAGSIGPLLEAIKGAKGVELEGKDHMNAVGALDYKRAVADFWNLDS